MENENKNKLEKEHIKYRLAEVNNQIDLRIIQDKSYKDLTDRQKALKLTLDKL